MRKRAYILLGLVALVLLFFAAGALYLFGPRSLTAENIQTSAFKEGDIVFQPSVSDQSLAIQIATRSRYSHCGIIVKKNGQLYVFEAISTVSFTPLVDWISRGVAGHYVLMRLKDPSALTPGVLTAMRKIGKAFAGKKYDVYFKWSDDTMYCSELVWKIYKRGAGIELAPLRTVRDYNLDNEIVLKKIRERFGNALRLDEKVIAPVDLMQSPLLEAVSAN
ncbi:MAG: YiiX family permuted papain-like enzyme [Burkholderiaceae bacterium]|jgi:hypothetical protein|nr:YiiX family permuted papain-like enzyme [Burkholderiaceae bacterium]